MFVLGILLFTLFIVWFLIIIKLYMEDETHYLNYNSTYATKTGYLNPSDLGYTNVYINRIEKEKVFNRIRKLVNAPLNSKVIINSGATESIATCINWCAYYNKYGKIIGTEHDHPSIKKNANVRGLKYETINDTFNPHDNISGVFITHVDSRTGEIISRDIKNIQMRFDEETKPLIFLDASQSITKININMEKHGYNVVFFSLHKIGGPVGMGVMIISEPQNMPFVPLIAGEQNEGLRGGTINEEKLVRNRSIFKMSNDTIDKRVEHWQRLFKYMKDKGVDVVEPHGKHLYNTYLIKTHPQTCPFKVVNKLSSEGIYIGTVSACENERLFNNNLKHIKEEKNNEYVRVSFNSVKDINKNVIDKIINALD